ncbi:MAG: potassium channel family protein [Micromonosporaceae bacterium]
MTGSRDHLEGGAERRRRAFAQRSAVERSRAFLRLLGGILLVYAVIITLGRLSFAAPLWVALLGLVLQLDAHTRRRSRRWQLTVAATGGGLFLATLAAGLAGSVRVLAGVAGAATLVLVVMVSASIVRTLADRPVVELSTVLGVLNVYLLLALVFASVHQIFGAVQVDYLDGVNGLPTSSDLLYFSVITMTTVGFGDITPGTDLARTVTVTEALIGQLYLVSVVAAVVGGWRTVWPTTTAGDAGTE